MNTISFQDFQKLDIRIGTVIEATVPEWSHWVMKLTVDFGPEIGERIIFAGIMKFYKPEELIGKQFPFIVNIAPKKIGPQEADGTQNYSEAMMLAACDVRTNDEGQRTKEEGVEEKPVLFRLWKKVPSGTKVR